MILLLTPASCRHVLLPTPVCFEKGQNYTVHIGLPLYSSYSDMQNPYTHIDSVRFRQTSAMQP